MNPQSAMRFRLGLFVLAAAGMLGVLIVLFAEMPGLFRRDLGYTVKFSQAPGIEPGTPVRKSGVKIGEVDNFELDPDSGEVAVSIRVLQRYQLRKGDQASLTRGLVLGDTAINFAPEGPDRTPAPDGHVFKGQPPGDLRQVLGKATDLLPLAQDAMEHFRQTAKNINESMPEIRRTLGELQVAANHFGKASESADNLLRGNQDKINKAVDQFGVAAGRAADLLGDENQRHVQAALRNFRTASDKLDGLMKSADTMLKNTDNTMKNVDQLTKNTDSLIAETRQAVKTVSGRMESVGKSAEDLIKDSRSTVKRANDTLTRGDEVLANFQQLSRQLNEKAPAILRNLEEATGRFSLMTSDAAEFIKALTAGDGTLRRLASDPALYNSINELATGLNRSMCRLDRILRDVELFADKVARHPELLGVSGAVAPSSGIKR